MYRDVCVCVCSVTQSRPTLCNLMDCSPPGSSVPGDSPGKNTGVGCYALLQGHQSSQFSSVTQSCPTLCDSIDCSLPGSSVHGDSPGKNAGVGCHAPLQGIFPIQGSNPGFPHCRQIIYHLTHTSNRQSKNNLIKIYLKE